VSLVPVALDVTPAVVSKAVAATQQLTAVVTDARGTVLTAQKGANDSVLTPIAIGYVSSNTAKATVSASGLITGVQAGTCTITATITGTSITDTVAVTIT
jgi:hypothetical protein